MRKFIDILEYITLGILIVFFIVLMGDLHGLKTRTPVRPVAPDSYHVPIVGPYGIVRLTNGGRTFCTGSVVNDTTVITAGHCVAQESPFGIAVNTDPIEIRSNDNVPRGTFGKVHSILPQLDSAVLKGNFKIYSKFKVIDDIGVLQGLRGQNLRFVACGYPLGGDLHCQVVTYHDLYNFMWEVDGLLLPGMSGGPVLAPDGPIIGINDAVNGNKSIIAPTFNIKRGF